MSSVVDHGMMPALYEFLRATRPFRSWGLPHADEIEFGILRKHHVRGDFRGGVGCPHSIRLSDQLIGFTDVAVRTMAHEMIHLKLEEDGCQGGDHGADFKRLAKQVCRVHGFDPKDF